jgi:TolB-like protein/DNA-binding winged helix-turn-helix (wHTH) protein/Flp pilus assembly protein TadD
MIYRFGGFELEPERRSLRSTESAQSVSLTAKLFDTLLYLIEHRGQLVEKQALLEAVWPNVIVEEANLAQTISMLRRALGEDSRVHEYIATIPGRGYQFVAAVELVGPESAAGAVAGRTAGRPHTGWSRLAYGLVALVVVAVAVSAGWSVFDRGAGRETEVSALLPNSVAVLPLQNLSPDPDDASIVLGIHQEIISQLAKIRDLNVIPRSSVLRYTGRQTPIPEVAAELRVEAILQGSARYAGDRIGVMVELIDGETGTLIWGDEYDGDLLDTVGIQADVASAIAAALEAELLPAERDSIQMRPTENLAAYEFYLRAVDAGSAEQGLPYLDRAIALDPDFALALGLKAANLSWLLINDEFAAPTSSEESAAIEQLALELAAKTLRLDASVSSAWVTRGDLHQLHWRWKEAGEAYARAVEVGAKDANTLISYARFNMFIGNHEMAVRVAQQAIDLDPTTAEAHWTQGWPLGALGRHEESLAANRKALSLDRTSILFQRSTGAAASRLGRYREAEESFRAAEQMLEGHPSPGVWLPGLAYGYAMLELHDDALRLIKEYDIWADTHAAGAGNWALIYLAMRDEERAIEALNTALAIVEAGDVDPGFWALMGIKHNLFLDPMLEQPKFVALRNRILDD